jgi:hypothetical protein
MSFVTPRRITDTTGDAADDGFAVLGEPAVEGE